MSVSFFLARLVPLAAGLLLWLHAGLVQAQPRGIDRLLIFGGSLSDTGNAFVFLSDPANRGCGARQSVPPYDMLDDLILPDGPYAKGGHHFSNGATWAEGLARSLALAGNARPALRGDGKGSNYAVGGARAVTFPCRFNLPEQVQAALRELPRISPNTLVTLEIGGNDVRDAIALAASGQNPIPRLQSALESMVNSIAALYAHGARKFLVLNVANPARAPSVRLLEAQSPGVAALATGLTLSFNAQLTDVVVQYAKGLGGTDVRVLDLYGLLEEIVATPAGFGIANTTDACVLPDVPPFTCKDPDSYLFWDGIHPTRAVHALVSQRAMAVISAP